MFDSTYLLKIDKAIAVDWQVRDIETLLLQMPARVQNTLVLGLRGDHMPLLFFVKVRNPFDCDVVRLCCSRREDDFFGRGSN